MLQASLHEKYDDKRLMIRRKHSENSRQHLVAGLKGSNSQGHGRRNLKDTNPLMSSSLVILFGVVKQFGRF